MSEPTVEKKVFLFLSLSSSFKIVFVGDGESGQHSLLITICTGVYPGQALYCDNEPFVKQVQYEGKAVNLTMHFTEGSETYDRIRPFTYKMADIAVIVFAVNKPSSFESIREKWAPEVGSFLFPTIKCQYEGSRINSFEPKLRKCALIVDLQKNLN
jgi:GTPase SAR1 family protein